MDEEITIKMHRKLWVDLLVDLDWIQEQLGELEPGSYQLIRELFYQGVEL